MNDIYRLIRSLGITRKYKGYYITAEAVRLIMGYQEGTVKITKDIYPILARKMHSKPGNIEHNMRTVIDYCWKTNKKALEEMAGCELVYKPSNAEFVDILVFYLRSREEEERKAQ